MGKKGKHQDGGFGDDTAAAANDHSTKFMSYKQQLEKEKKEANKGITSKANKDYVSDSDEEAKPQKKQKKTKKADDNFEDEQEAQRNSQGELEANFEGIGKKNTRKKKTKDQNIYT